MSIPIEKVIKLCSGVVEIYEDNSSSAERKNTAFSTLQENAWPQLSEYYKKLKSEVKMAEQAPADKKIDWEEFTLLNKIANILGYDTLYNLSYFKAIYHPLDLDIASPEASSMSSSPDTDSPLDTDSQTDLDPDSSPDLDPESPPDLEPDFLPELDPDSQPDLDPDSQEKSSMRSSISLKRK